MNQSQNSSFAMKEKFVKFVESQNPKAAAWIAKLVGEIENRKEHLEIRWSQPLPNTDYPVSAQIFVKKWNVNPLEILADDVFFYFEEPRFYFDGHGEAGAVPIWEFPDNWQKVFSEVLKTEGRGGILLTLINKQRFDRTIWALDTLIQYSNKYDIIWHNGKTGRTHTIA